MAKREINKRFKRRGRTDKRKPFTLSEEAADCGVTVQSVTPPGEQNVTPPGEQSVTPPGEQNLTPSQAGKILGVTGACVKQWIFARRLRATQLSNGYWKIKAQDLLDYMKARQDLNSQNRIMIVDTAHTNKAVEAVEKLGHLPIVADSKSNALLKAADLYPALFIINVSASELEPWKLIEQIRTTRSIRNAPMILLSNKSLSDKESDQALKMRVQSVLVRPFTTQKLKAEMERIVSRIR